MIFSAVHFVHPACCDLPCLCPGLPVEATSVAFTLVLLIVVALK